jgi:chemotaxis regulatin CheY-phosphate phosphatase CheZ
VSSNTTDSELHDAYWGIQRQIGKAQHAISDARQVMHAVLNGKTGAAEMMAEAAARIIRASEEEQ